jgi:hypothetical protein
MKHLFKYVLVLTCITVLAAISIPVQAQEKMLIALKTSDFELTETDISSLATGESKTIETDSGKIIDILKTAEGVEIYVDGELLDMSPSHGGHMIENHVEIICDKDESNHCSDRAILVDMHGEIELEELHEGEGGYEVIVIKKEVLVED